MAETIHRQAETIQQLRDEIAVLKGEKPKPTFKPSGMEKQTDPNVTDGRDGDGDGESKGKRPGSAKRHKTQDLIIHEECPIPPRDVPAGARFKGYRDFVVQDLKIEPHNTRYRLEVWRTPTASIYTASCRRRCKTGILVRGYVPTCSISTISVMSPSRCCANNCWNGASTSPRGRSMPC